jgi:hypothetical protein
MVPGFRVVNAAQGHTAVVIVVEIGKPVALRGIPSYCTPRARSFPANSATFMMEFGDTRAWPACSTSDDTDHGCGIARLRALAHLTHPPKTP